MNSILLLSPYKDNGIWVFDDSRVGLVREPFVMGIDVMLDQVTKNIPNAERGFNMLFSSSPFPGYVVHLKWLRSEYGGNWYHCPELSVDGWLCPALFKYFDQVPECLYIQVKQCESPPIRVVKEDDDDEA